MSEASIECAVPPLEDVPELLEKIKLSAGSKSKNEHSTPRCSNISAFGGFRKGFLSSASSNKKKVTHAGSAKPSSHSNGCSKSSLAFSDSVKSTSEPSKLTSSKVVLEAPKQSEARKLPFVLEDSKSPKFVPKTSQSLTVLHEPSEIVSGKNKSQKQECVPHIKAQPGVQSLVIPEVQEAVRRNDPSTAFELAAHARLTPSTSVSDILEDPSWLEILAEFQDDPEAAMVKYRNNTEVRSVMTQLCATLGDNFLNLSTTRKKSEDDALVERIMSEQAVRDALQSPRVQHIMELAKAGRNDVVRRLMADASDEDRRHIRTLLDFGLFSFSC